MSDDYNMDSPTQQMYQAESMFSYNYLDYEKAVDLGRGIVES